MYKSNHKGNLESSLETIQDSGHPGESTMGRRSSKKEGWGELRFQFLKLDGEYPGSCFIIIF